MSGRASNSAASTSAPFAPSALGCASRAVPLGSSHRADADVEAEALIRGETLRHQLRPELPGIEHSEAVGRGGQRRDLPQCGGGGFRVRVQGADAATR